MELPLNLCSSPSIAATDEDEEGKLPEDIMKVKPLPSS
jgi:hypothetical protein